MGKIVVQSIWLTVVFLILAIISSPFYIVSLVVGLVPFLYLKKESKKDVLKINFLSSLIAFIVLFIIYMILSFINRGYAPTSVSWMVILSIVNLNTLLLYGGLSALLFNVPFLVYFIFGKEDN